MTLPPLPPHTLPNPTFSPQTSQHPNTANLTPRPCSRRWPQNFKPRIHFTPSDFSTITEHGALCGPDQTLTVQQFETVMRIQLQRFSLARLAEVHPHEFHPP
jgi:hypothetical protein